MITRKLDLHLYNNILKDIIKNVKLKNRNSTIIKDLWGTLEMDSYGKIHSTPQSYIYLERLLNDPKVTNEITDFYNTLVYIDINKNNGK